MKSNISLIFLAAAFASQASGAIVLTNGNFSTNDTIGWTTTGTVNASSGAAVINSGGSLHQDFSNGTIATAENFNFQLDVQLSVSSVALTDTTRIRIRDNDNLGDLITLRLNGTTIERFQGTFAPTGLTGLAITPNTPFWIRVIGTNLDLPGRTFTVGFSNDGTSYTTTDPLTAFHIAPVGSDFETLRIEPGSGTTMTVDNITVIPEPSSALLGGLGVLALLRRRRA